MESFYKTDVGRIRSMNQDAVFSSDGKIGKLPNVFVVADGMGGHNAGDRASCCAIETFLSSVRRQKREKNPVRIIEKAMTRANERVYTEANSEERYSGMGTTMVVAAVDHDTLYVANVGDSRLYLIRGTEIRQITRDHSLVEEMIRGGCLTREEGWHHPDKNVITRAIGVGDKVQIDFFEEEMEKGDTILMCTDGLSNMVSDEEICELIGEADDLKSAGENLVKKANENGGSDNITVLLMRKQTNEVVKC